MVTILLINYKQVDEYMHFGESKELVLDETPAHDCPNLFLEINSETFFSQQFICWYILQFHYIQPIPVGSMHFLM